MERKSSVVMATFGAVFVFVSLFLGVLFTFGGLCGVIIGVTGGGNLCGLGLIFGLPALVLGIILLCLLRPAYLLLKRNLNQYQNQEGLTPQERKLLSLSVVILFVVSILMSLIYISPYVSYRAISNFNPYNLTPEMIRSMKAAIKKEFKKHDTVVLQVYYHPPYFKDSFYQQSEESKKEIIDSQFISDYYLKIIGINDAKRFKKSRGYSFIVEVTEAGYEKLRQSEYLRAIELFNIPPKYQ